MTSRLAMLRSQLNRLRRARAALRAVSAWSALASSVLIALVAVFILDLIFVLAVPERAVVLLLAAVAVGWSYWRFTRPLLGRRETPIDVALVVERQHQIDSDLVAALEFEQPEAAAWGSPQLSDAVVEYVAAGANGIDVFRGLDRKQTLNRSALLAAMLVAVLVAGTIWPGHIRAFANRLCLGSRHYPTRTRIEQILVNGAAVLPGGGAKPVDSKAAQGRPLTFLIQCSGQLPAEGAVYLSATSAGHARTRLDLKPVALDERLRRLQETISKLNEAIQNADGEIPVPWRNEVLSLIRFDAPSAVEPLLAAKTYSELSAAVASVTKTIENWPGESRQTAILMGELGRLNDDVIYKVAAGDASSDAALVHMIPLPIVEVELTPTPPKYAAVSAPKSDASGRQLAVLEGSSVDVVVSCTNHKPLQSAWLLLHKAGGHERIDLVSRDSSRAQWSVQAASSPFRQLHEELRYEVQVIDADGLSLEAPIRGAIRIRPDQPPTGVAEVVHKVVLPTAAPVIRYRASDDFGISGLAIVVEVERGGTKGTAAAAEGGRAGEGNSAAPATVVPTESHRFEVLTPSKALTGDQLPLVGQYAFSLSPLKLAKGDRLKLTLEVTDYRGENDAGRPMGTAERSEALMLEVSDESGVLAAISQPDQRSAEQLSEIIKRQLGIGEVP